MALQKTLKNDSEVMSPGMYMTGDDVTSPLMYVVAVVLVIGVILTAAFTIFHYENEISSQNAVAEVSVETEIVTE